MYLHRDVGLPRNPPQHRERLLPVLLDCVTFLIVVARTGQGPVMRDSLLVVNSIVGFPARAEGIHFALVLARVRFLEVAWQLVRAGLGELIVVFYTGKGGTLMSLPVSKKLL